MEKERMTVRFISTPGCLRLPAATALLAMGLLAAACSSLARSATPAADVGLGTPVSPAELATQPATATKPPVSVNGPAVTINNFNFTPATITVSTGATVTWVNRDDVPHTVIASDKSFSSQNIDTDGQFSQKFDTPGTYSYFCAIHPFMTAKVVVQ
jgi:plastocyanin